MATTDILTNAEALAAINAPSLAAGPAGELVTLVSAVSGVIDSYCGPVVAREVTEIHAGGSSTIWPHQAPVLSVTSLTEFDGSTETVLTDESAFGTVGGASGFVLSPDGLSIGRRVSGNAYYFGAGTIEVVYQAGRFASTATVSPKFKAAASGILRRLWKREASSWAYSPDFFANTDEGAAVTGSGFFRAVEPMVAEWLWDERRAPAIA